MLMVLLTKTAIEYKKSMDKTHCFSFLFTKTVLKTPLSVGYLDKNSTICRNTGYPIRGSYKPPSSLGLIIKLSYLR